MAKATPLLPLSWSQPLKGLKPRERKARLAKREAWLKQIDPSHLFHRLFDLLPDVYFFAKTRDGEMMFINRHAQDLYHLNDEAEIIGLTDFDLNPKGMAQSYVSDDERIYATGQPLLQHVELWFNLQGIPDWFVVNKLPIRSRTGEIIGIMGMLQSYSGRAKLLQPFDGIAKAVNYLRENYSQNISVAELARHSSLSPRQLERRFKGAFGVGPQQFLIKTRLLAACRALRETERGVADIALSCGFSDQSSFTRHFHKHTGSTPTAYRHGTAKLVQHR